MDIVILNSPDSSDNVELLFTLRSIEKHLKGHRKVFIVGSLPKWIEESKVTFIPFATGDKKAVNIAERLLTVQKNKSVTATFVYFTNDVILLVDKNVNDIENYHKGEINENIDGSYGYFLKQTKEELIKKGLPTLNYDTHYPFVLNKKMLKEAFDKFDFKDSQIGFGTRSMYGNYHKLDCKQVKDCKYRNEINKKLDYISTDENNITKELFDFLTAKFPEQSKFEKTDFDFNKVAISKKQTVVQFTYNGKDNIHGTFNVAIHNAEKLKKAGYGNFEY
jgi:hypothetical protein